MAFYVKITFISLFILLPIILVLANKSFSRREKIVGIASSLFFSWIGFIVFFILSILQRNYPRSASDHHDEVKLA